MKSKIKNFSLQQKQKIQSVVPAINSSFVSIYKLVGFLLLACIVSAMFFYLGCGGFYIFNHHWLVPTILTPQNERVIQAHTMYLDRVYQLEVMKAEIAQMEQEEIHLNFVMHLQDLFQTSFTQGLQNEKLRYDQDIANYNTVFNAIKSETTSAPANPKLTKTDTLMALENQLQAGLITKEDFTRFQQQLQQTLIASIEREGKWIELQKQQKSLSASLDAFHRNPDRKKENALLALSPEKSVVDVNILLRQKPLFDSIVTSSELQVRRSPLSKKKNALEKIIESYTKLVESSGKSPLVRAASGPVMVAFVPYENLENMKDQSEIYGCYLEFFLCKKVGRIQQILPGEVVAKHPLSGRELRGQWVELQLDTLSSWAQDHSLIANHPPLFL